MPALSAPRSDSPEPSPRLEWPEFSHPAPATIIALIVTFTVVNTFFFVAWQLLKKRFAGKFGSAAYGKCPDDGHDNQQRPASSASDGAAKRALRQASPSSEIENKSKQHLADERTPLCSSGGSQAHVSLYDTFQIPPPHTTSLKFSPSLMELNSDNPLESGESTPKAKTIHWHGINRLNTAWGWMS